MDSLIRYGFTIEEIKILMDTNEEISSVSDNHVSDIIKLLESINCDKNEIKNILICNPFCLSNSIKSLKKTIIIISSILLNEFGFIYLNLLFSNNPYILNMSDKELEKLYNKKKEDGLTKEEIIDFISYNIIF